MVIALLTDFGTKDYFVGAMKGVILSIDPKSVIVDITHEIPPQNIKHAGFTLRSCYKNFPRKTIFVSVVDPGVGSNRRALLVETEDYFFIAPDNGLLSFIFDEPDLFRVYEIREKKYLACQISRTFHGRDVFAPAAAHLSAGVVPFEFGKKIEDFVRFETGKPRRISPGLVSAKIIHIDNFGNLITNLQKENLPEKFYLKIRSKKIEMLYNYFEQAEKDEIFMILGSAGFLEIVAFQNSAQNLLNVNVGEKLELISI